ncbi:MAG TPA: hypothetical protein VHS81_07130 [Caulobacteraceae bacterium]|nr:hypothetical protein [Caulobacteraceae bacterium]
MTDILERYPYLFPLFFGVMWLAVTTLIAVYAGWFGLQARYPDQTEAPIRRWSMASGRFGPLASYSNCLVLAVCPSGLRIGIWRVFGPFCRNIFVPWADLRVERLGWSTRLAIGPPGTGYQPMGRLTISDSLASEIAAAAGKAWPAAKAVAEPLSAWKFAQRLLLQWAFISVTASLFFVFAPRLLGRGETGLPVTVAIAFPTLFFGAAALIQFLAYLARRPRLAR